MASRRPSPEYSPAGYEQKLCASLERMAAFTCWLTLTKSTDLNFEMSLPVVSVLLLTALRPLSWPDDGIGQQ